MRENAVKMISLFRNLDEKPEISKRVQAENFSWKLIDSLIEKSTKELEMEEKYLSLRFDDNDLDVLSTAGAIKRKVRTTQNRAG